MPADPSTPVVAAPDAELVAGRYRLGEPLGRGGMGDVYAAQDVRLGRPVAVKLLRWDWTERPEMRRRFEAEARAAARLNHPNVIAVYDTGEHHGVPFIVMERLSGRTLADELATGPLDPDRAVAVARQLLAALDAAHRQGVLHRDIKPANLLLTASGDIKVADFGIAKVAEQADATVTGLVLGTPSYLAPERLAGEAASAGGDVYAAGVLLHEMLLGRAPFAATAPLALLNAMQTTTPERVDHARPGLPPALGDVVERALARDPSSRYGTAAAMAAALGAAAPRAGGPSTASVPPTAAAWPTGEGPSLAAIAPPGMADPAHAATRALAPPPGAPADATALLGPPTAVDARPVGVAAAPAYPGPPAPAGPRGRRSWLIAVVAVLVAVIALGVAYALARSGDDGTDTPTTVPAATTTPPATVTTATPGSTTATTARRTTSTSARATTTAETRAPATDAPTTAATTAAPTTATPTTATPTTNAPTTDAPVATDSRGGGDQGSG